MTVSSILLTTLKMHFICIPSLHAFSEFYEFTHSHYYLLITGKAFKILFSFLRAVCAMLLETSKYLFAISNLENSQRYSWFYLISIPANVSDIHTVARGTWNHPRFISHTQSSIISFIFKEVITAVHLSLSWLRKMQWLMSLSSVHYCE